MSQTLIDGLAQVNRAELYYEIQGSGHPLLLLHAGIADSRMWDDQMAAFSQHFRTIRFDMRGFGQSQMPAGPFCNHEDVAGMLDFLEIERTHVLGISFGGLNALDFALAFPHRVSALVLGAPSISGQLPTQTIRNFWDEEERLLDEDDFETATELNLRMWVDGPHRTPDQVDQAVRKMVTVMQLQAFEMPIPDDIDQVSLDPPAIDRLSEITAPTLIIVGSLDLPEKLELVDRLVCQLKNGVKVIMPDVAHMMNMEKPAAFNSHVIQFLNAIEKAGD